MDIKSFIRRFHTVLEAPYGYSLLLFFSGAGAGRKAFIRKHSGIKPGTRVLEIGCGPGTNLTHLPKETSYTGCDYNPFYIKYANKKYGKRGTFICLSVDDLANHNIGTFDAALIVSVLHHLNDDQVRGVAKNVRKVLRPGGEFIIWEPCWTNHQSWLDRFMLSIDRGRYVRKIDDYVHLLKESFDSVDYEFYMTEKMIWPQSGCILRAKHS